MIQNFEVKKKGESFVILEQAGSNYHEDRPIFEAASRADVESWLADRGADLSEVARALDDAGSSERVFIAVAGDYSEAEGFPKE